MKLKKIISYILFVFLLLFATYFLINHSLAKEEMKISDQFPSSYAPYIEELKRKYPNWTFKALYTNLDWKYVIDNENIFGKNLVPKSYSNQWKNTKPGEYNIEVDAGWVDCSRQAIEYTMDPRNFLNYIRVFQFEELSYEPTTNSISSIEKILYGTEFYDRIVEYKTADGNNIVTDQKYSQLILAGAIRSDVSAFHLASRIKQEVGPFLSHSSISGTVEGFKGLYNFYNIGATSSAEPMGAIKNGLQYAKDGKGASQSTKDKYLIPWNTKEIAIKGGAIFIGSSYINLGQNSIYLQKFHVYDNKKQELFWRQYMTNVLAPYSESKGIYNGYNSSGLLDSPISFVIPVYENMPEIPVKSPSISESDFIADNTRVYANVSNTLNMRSGPGTSYEILATIPAKTTMTRIEKGRQSGEVWDRVKLDNGMVGYIFQNYLAEQPPQISVTEIKLSIDNPLLNKGEKKQLKIEILPEEAKESKISLSSNNPQVVTVDSDGKLLAISSGKATITATAENGVSAKIGIEVYSKVTGIELNTNSLILQEGQEYKINPIILPDDANNKKVSYSTTNENVAIIDTNGTLRAINKGEVEIVVQSQEQSSIQTSLQVTVIPVITEDEIKFDTSFKILGNEISGLDYQNNTVEKILQKIQTKYNIEILDVNQQKLENQNLVGTGSKIRFLQDDELFMEYQVILYGDINGDGKINSVDLLVLQRHILEIQKVSGVALKAGNINKNGKNPSSVDLLLIQRHILQLKIIEQ